MNYIKFDGCYLSYKQCTFCFFASRRRHTRCSRDWSSDVCSSDLDIEYKDFFTTTDNENEYQDVIRPRTSKLFKKFIVDRQEKSLWCTFSHDQIDFNFKNPNVLIFFLKILKLYLEDRKSVV